MGSILAITDKNGNVKEKRHFDAWGNIVKWVDGNNAPINKGMIGGGVLDRGYTGHEHLFGAGLIHMNGRLYDPVLHRFTMPDNFVQDPYSTLSYNRYSYVINNPLMYVDPSGEFFGAGETLLLIGYIVVATIIGGSIVKALKQARDARLEQPSNAEPPTPSGGQGGSGNIASSLGPDTGQIYNLDVPLGIGQGFSHSSPSTWNNSASSIGGGLDFNPFAGFRPFTGEAIGEQPGPGLGTKILDGFQTVLDVIGLVPVVGEIADGVNALIYLGRGDYLNASLSAAAMIPIAGWAATGGKLWVKLFKAGAGEGLELAAKGE